MRSRLVQLPVTVTDSESRAKDGLGAADFIVLDNGVARQATVDTIGRGVAPIALAVAVQGSGLSAAVIAKVQKIGGMIQLLITGESGCAALLSFSTRVNIRRVLLIIAESRDRFATYSQFKTAFTSDNRPLTARRSQTEAVPQVWETADNKPLKFQREVQGRSVSSEERTTAQAIRCTRRFAPE